ncbi:MAG: tRNA (guanosine(46)-N7)-methyltransferase TrmB [Phycisphaerales bacterium]|nr:tRNA (guanosine(46)-N7)-methyltransferase TrmB [Phycisphaerales bacterium]
MSFGLARGKELDPSPISVTETDLPPLPDEAIGNPTAGRVDLSQWFVNVGGEDRRALPLHIEIGSGKGTFLVQQAAIEPEVNFLGIEWAGEFLVYGADRVRRAGLRNVRMLRTDATEFLRWRVADGTVDVIHLYFSDPWPKTRHHKNRVMQDSFLEEAHRVLKPAAASGVGELRLVTDHDELWAWYQRHFERWTGKPDSRYELLPFERPTSAGEGELVGSNFERKYKQEGRPFHAAVMKKK